MQIDLKSNYNYFISYLLGIVLMTSCSITRPSSHKNPPANQSQRNHIAAEAQEYLGSPYKYGGNSRKGLDCSGLVHIVFREAGIQLPRISSQQFKSGRSILIEKSQKGDLLFFTQKGKVNHVGIVTMRTKGSIWVIHSTTSKGVIYEDVLASSYWRSRIRGARDVVNSK